MLKKLWTLWKNLDAHKTSGQFLRFLCCSKFLEEFTKVKKKRFHFCSKSQATWKNVSKALEFFWAD
jgi:hypothetical protein